MLLQCVKNKLVKPTLIANIKPISKKKAFVNSIQAPRASCLMNEFDNYVLLTLS